MKFKRYIIGGTVLILMAGAILFYLYIVNRGGGNALAVVNGREITVDRFHHDVERIQEPARAMFKEDPSRFLEVMIMKALILQEARKQGSQGGKEEKGEEALIQEFLEKKFSSPPTVGREEIETFYEAHKEKMEGRPLEVLAPMIEQVIRQGKQEEEQMRFFEEIRNRAAIEINQERLKEITAKPPDSNTEEDFSRALKSGRPILIDFGSNTCIPCRQLRPILQEIKKEKTGKMEVLVIDVYRYQDLAREYRIQVIPTLIFFDSNGKEAFRHQGFMPKAALLELLGKVGVG